MFRHFFKKSYIIKCQKLVRVFIQVNAMQIIDEQKKKSKIKK